MTKNTKGKHQTNFFIRNAEYQLEHSRYQYEKTLPLAKSYYNVIKSALPEIKKIKYVGALDDDMLMWNVMLYFLTKEISTSDDRMIKELHLEHGAPIRPDGTRHWVRATFTSDDIMKTDKSEDGAFKEFGLDAGGFGLKSNYITPENIRSIQLDSPFICDWRTLSTNEMQGIKRVLELQKNGEEPNNYDKAIISALIEKGYVSRIDGKLSLHILYFDVQQKKELDDVLDKYAGKLLNRDENEKIYIGYSEHLKKFIPSCVSENERNHNITSYDPYNAVLWLLMKNGYLKKPDSAERKYICTVMWSFE